LAAARNSETLKQRKFPVEHSGKIFGPEKIDKKFLTLVFGL